MPTGYDVKWTEELEEAILDIVSQGGTLKDIEKKTGIKTSPLFLHRRKSKTFEQKYSIAQEQGFEHDADSLKTAHDDIPDPMKARLFSENNRWLLARRAAHRYGDRLDITVGQTVDMTQALTDARRRAGHSVEYFDQDTIEVSAQKIEGLIERASSEGTNSEDANSVVLGHEDPKASVERQLIDIIS